MAKVYWVQRLRNWAQRHPAVAVVIVVWSLYSSYLPTTTYDKLYYDAYQYWAYAEKYYATGSFEFLSYFNSQRGYLYSLLLAPFTQLSISHAWPALDVMRFLGAGLAAAIFGWAGPALWQAVQGGTPVSLGRRLLFAGLGFVLWRDYFNFSLTDFPALFALSIALVGTLRGRGLASSLVAGIALAAAVNMRPVYQAAMPAVALLVLLPPLGRPRWWGLLRGSTLVLGAAAVLSLQLYSNVHHQGIWSPWVITNDPSKPSLYLDQLGWGLAMQKYETNVGTDYPTPTMRFEDKRGMAMFASTGLKQFTDASQYVNMCLGQPVKAVGVWTRHLFNGMDLQYPTPYIQEVFVPTWELAWVNYSVIWGGILVLLAYCWQPITKEWIRPGLVLVALLLPCAASLPTAMECRFLLPLHLLLSAAVAFGASPRRWWQTASRRGRAGLAISYVAVIVAGFSASASAQNHLALTPRDITDDVPLYRLMDALTPAPEPQPW